MEMYYIALWVYIICEIIMVCGLPFLEILIYDSYTSSYLIANAIDFRHFLNDGNDGIDKK